LAGGATGAGAILLLATPARAECLGDGCYDGLLWVLIGMAVYALALLAALGMVIFSKTRRAGLTLLGSLAVIGLGAFLLVQ
jgi:hypothetical protein